MGEGKRCHEFFAWLISELRLEPRTPSPVLVLLQQCLQGTWQARGVFSEKVCRSRTQLCPDSGKASLSLRGGRCSLRCPCRLPTPFLPCFQALMSLFVLASKDGWVNIMYNGLDAVAVDQQVGMARLGLPGSRGGTWCLWGPRGLKLASPPVSRTRPSLSWPAPFRQGCVLAGVSLCSDCFCKPALCRESAVSWLCPEGCRACGWRNESKRRPRAGPAARTAGACLGRTVTGSGSHEARAGGRRWKESGRRQVEEVSRAERAGRPRCTAGAGAEGSGHQ